MYKKSMQNSDLEPAQGRTFTDPVYVEGAEHGATFETLKHTEPTHPEGATDHRSAIFGVQRKIIYRPFFNSKLKSLLSAPWAGRCGISPY